MDKRMLKTEDELYKAFVGLLVKKPYNQITVDEICEKADIRRPTFYNHYKDKNDFAKVGLTRYFNRILVMNYSIDNLSFRDYFTTLLETCLIKINNSRNEHIFLKENSKEHIVYLLFHNTIYNLLLNKYNSNNNEYGLDDISKELLVRSYTGIFINITVYFINDESLKVDTILEKIGDLSYKLFYKKK